MYNGILKDPFSNINLLKIVNQRFVKQTIHVDVLKSVYIVLYTKCVYIVQYTKVYTLYSIQKVYTLYSTNIHKKIHKKIYIMLIKKETKLN